jgi:hypothetical protein
LIQLLFEAKSEDQSIRLRLTEKERKKETKEKKERKKETNKREDSKQESARGPL